MKKDNICALATASGIGAISIIRVSGPDAIAICDQLFKSVKRGKSLLEQKSHTIHFGSFMDNDKIGNNPGYGGYKESIKSKSFSNIKD